MEPGDITELPPPLFSYDAEARASFLRRPWGTRQEAGGERRGGPAPAWTRSVEVSECAPTEVT